jgi:hypothetical protein
MERELAMARHESKEAHRRTEQEQELRRKTEQERTELRKRLEDETNRRTKEQNNSHHVAEKISSLEKERNQVRILIFFHGWFCYFSCLKMKDYFWFGWVGGVYIRAVVQNDENNILKIFSYFFHSSSSLLLWYAFLQIQLNF